MQGKIKQRRRLAEYKKKVANTYRIVDKLLNAMESALIIEKEIAFPSSDNREFPCDDDNCGGEYEHTSTHPNGQVYYNCNECGHSISFP